MKLRARIKFRLGLAMGLIALPLMFWFQNCGNAGFKVLAPGSLSNSESALTNSCDPAALPASSEAVKCPDSADLLAVQTYTVTCEANGQWQKVPLSFSSSACPPSACPPATKPADNESVACPSPNQSLLLSVLRYEVTCNGSNWSRVLLSKNDDQCPRLCPRISPYSASCTPVVDFGPNKHFGYYWTDASIAAEVSATADIAMATSEVSNIQAVGSLGLKAVVIVTPQFFYLDPSDNRIKMHTDYKTRWANFVLQAKSQQGSISAFYPLDEPFWNGINHGVPESEMLAFLELVGTTIKADFPTIPIVMIEAYPMIDDSLKLPASFDIFGFDCYDGWDVCGGTTAARPGFTPQSIMTYFGVVKTKVNQLIAADGRMRKIALIPPSSIYVDSHGHWAMTEEQLRAIADNYMNLALSEPMVNTVINFIWNDLVESAGVWKALKGLSPATLAKYKYFSNQILARSSRIQPVSVTASSSVGGSGPEFAIDGKSETAWNAGDFASATAPKWIQLDLGLNTTIMEIKLKVTQSPNGATIHEIWGGPSNDEASMTQLEKISQITSEGDLISLKGEKLSGRSDIRYLRVKTTSSPSWVGWREIEVFGVGK